MIIVQDFSCSPVARSFHSSQSPAAVSRGELALTLLCRHDVNGIGRADVVPRPQIVWRSDHRQPVERDEFIPSRFDGETSAHLKPPFSVS
jgi:hypothetical protein